MKHTFYVLLFVCFSYTSNANNNRLFFSVGTPKERFKKDFPSYNIDLMMGRIISDKSLLGIGASYFELDFLPVYTTFIYDKKILSFYSSYIYEIFLTEKLRLLPQFRLGYSFVKANLVYFSDNELKTDGVYLSGETYFSYNLSKSIDTFVGLSFNKIFSEVNHNLKIYTTNIIGDHNKLNYNILKIGCTYKF